MFLLGPCCFSGQESKTIRRETADTGIRHLLATLLVFLYIATVSGFNSALEKGEQTKIGGKGLPNAEECGQAGYRPTNLNESPSEETRDWPWMVPILYKKKLLCSGILITDRHLLTSASCLYGNSTKLPISWYLDVKFGVDDLTAYNSRPKQWNYVSKISVHPDYNKETRGNDIAVLNLNTKVKMEPNMISPVCLPKEAPGDLKQEDYIYNYAIVAGWDQEFPFSISSKDPASTLGDPALKELRVQFYAGKRCRKTCKGNDMRHIKRSVICATPFHKEAYIGNIGGAIFKMMDPMRWKVIGIFSKRCQDNSTESASEYTRVGKYIYFIKSCINVKPRNYDIIEWLKG